MTSTTLRALSLLWLIATAGLQGCHVDSSATGATEVKLGQQVFAIPESNQSEKAIPDWLRWLPGLDDGSRDFLLKFSAAEVGRDVTDYRVVDGSYQEDIVAVLAVLDSAEVKRYRAGERFSDLWHGTGSYADAISEPLGDTGWHKIYRKVEYPYSWAVVKQLPIAGKPLPNPSDFWVAQCLAGDSPLTPSGKRVACKSYVFFGDLVVNFEISEQNLKVIDGVANYLKARVNAWRQS